MQWRCSFTGSSSGTEAHLLGFAHGGSGVRRACLMEDNYHHHETMEDTLPYTMAEDGSFCLSFGKQDEGDASADVEIKWSAEGTKAWLTCCGGKGKSSNKSTDSCLSSPSVQLPKEEKT